MGKFDKIEQNHADDYKAMERIGDSHQHEKMPMKDEVDVFKVKKELDTTTPDQLVNQCKKEKEGEKHQLLMFYTNRDGKGEWMRVALPKYRIRKYGKRGYFEVVDCRNGHRKTVMRQSMKTVRKCIERSTGEWTTYHGAVDLARFK